MPAYVIQTSGSTLGNEPVAGNRQHSESSLLTRTERLRYIEVGMSNIAAHQPGSYNPTQAIKQGYALQNGQWKEIWPNPKTDRNEMYWRVVRPYGRDSHAIKPPNEWGGNFMIWGSTERKVIYTFKEPVYRTITHVEIEAYINDGHDPHTVEVFAEVSDSLGGVTPDIVSLKTTSSYWSPRNGGRGYKSSGKQAIGVPPGKSIAVIFRNPTGDPGDGISFAYGRLKNIWWDGDSEPTPILNNP